MRLIAKIVMTAVCAAMICALPSSAQPMAGDQQSPSYTGDACRADADQYCSGARLVGPDEMQQCLVLHVQQLSEPCRNHLVQEKLVAPAAGPGSTDSASCMPDQSKLCPKTPFLDSTHEDVVYECLARHLKDLSPTCREQTQAVRERAKQNALTEVVLGCKAESARFCKGLLRRSLPFFDCLFDNEKNADQACSAALEAARPYRDDLKAKVNVPKRPWWHFW